MGTLMSSQGHSIAAFSFLLNGQINRFQQGLIADGLNQISNRARLYSSTSRFLFIMRRKEDERHLVVCGEQTSLQIQAAHSEHPQLRDAGSSPVLFTLRRIVLGR